MVRRPGLRGEPRWQGAPQVRHPLPAGLDQELGGQGRADARMAEQHHGPLRRSFRKTLVELRQGNQQAAGKVTIGTLELLSAAHIHQGEGVAMVRHPGGLQLRQAGVAALQWSPAVGRGVVLLQRPAAAQICSTKGMKPSSAGGMQPAWRFKIHW